MHDQIEITIAGKTSRMKPEKFVSAFKEYIEPIKWRWIEYEMHAFLQTYGK